MNKILKNWYAMSDPAVMEILGAFIKKTRLKQNRTQQEISDAAGINRSTLVLLEKGNGGTLLSFIQVLRALKQLQLLEIFEVKQELSPLLLAENEKKNRRRARVKQVRNNKAKSTW